MNFFKKNSVNILIAILIIICIVVIILFLSKDKIELNNLISKENYFELKSISGDNIKHINITEDKILYIYEEKNNSKKLINKYYFDDEKNELIKFDINNLSVVSPDEKQSNPEDTKYFEMKVNDSIKLIYQKELYEILEKYDIEVGED